MVRKKSKNKLSTIRSLNTVPILILTGIWLVFFKTTQRINSPNLGKTRLARKPTYTAKVNLNVLTF